VPWTARASGWWFTQANRQIGSGSDTGAGDRRTGLSTIVNATPSFWWLERGRIDLEQGEPAPSCWGRAISGKRGFWRQCKLGKRGKQAVSG